MEMTWYEFTWAVINFLVLLFILYKLFYKPVLTFLENRRSEIARNLAEAEHAREKADEILNQYREKLARAEKEAQEIIARATKAGEEERIKLIEQGHNEAAALLEKARAEIRKERDEALAALRKEIATLAVMAAGKILGRTVTKEDHEKLVDEFLSEVGEVH